MALMRIALPLYRGELEFRNASRARATTLALAAVMAATHATSAGVGGDAGLAGETGVAGGGATSICVVMVLMVPHGRVVVVASQSVHSDR